MKYILNYENFLLDQENKRLYESVSSQKFLSELTLKIIKYLAYNSSYDTDTNILTLSKWNCEDDSLDIEKYDTGFVDFLKFKSADVRLERSKYKRSNKGSYLEGRYYLGSIILFYDETLLDELSNDFEKYNFDKFVLENFLLSNFKNILIHELQHCYDDYKSDNKFLNTKDWHSFIKHRKQYNSGSYYDEYIKLPHEINANFTMCVNTINFIDYEKSKENKKNTKKSFNEVLNDFKNLMVRYGGYSITDEDIKRVLTKRLYVIWSEK